MKKQTTIILFVLIILSISFTSCKKVGELKVTVKNAETGEKLEQANVKLTLGLSDISTKSTDLNGEAIFGDLDEGYYTIEVSYNEYATSKGDFQVDKGKTTDAVISLTELNPTLTITSPSNSEAWKRGTSHDITWIFSDLEGNVKIELYNNQVLDDVIESNTECDGSYTWNIPANQAEGTKYKIKISSLENTGIYDESDNMTFITLENNFIVEMIAVTGGSFEMGCGTGQSDCSGVEAPVHTVTLDDFSISKYEITNQEYADFLNAYGSSTVISGEYAGETMIEESSGYTDFGLHNNSGTWEPVTGYENHPVICVTWFGANEFCQYYGGKLPTEAEWEYAARGGTNYTDYYLYSGSDNIEDVAWYDSNSGNATHEVGTKIANQLGIYDMSGNVWELCSDWYNGYYYYSSPTDNPTGPSSGSYRVLRGGGWNYYATGCRSAYRYRVNPAGSYEYLGFRIARSQ